MYYYFMLSVNEGINFHNTAKNSLHDGLGLATLCLHVTSCICVKNTVTNFLQEISVFTVFTLDIQVVQDERAQHFLHSSPSGGGSFLSRH